ncbi:MAG: hypothetical protein QOF21_785 [Actinomycetota bacterium]|jgi:hypothetical protein
MHPFVALMRRYCIDYTNSHDLTVCDDIMEPDYVVHISGFDLTRDESYRPAVHQLFGEAPGLGLVVHEFITNGDRLCMRFSEHAALPSEHGTRLACWAGIGLYRWNGTRLTECSVEQDFLARHIQLASGAPHALEPPHLDPWVSTSEAPADAAAEDTVRAWLTKGDIFDADTVVVDDSSTTGQTSLVIDPSRVDIKDLFSAGPRVAFHAAITGAYRGGLPDVGDDHIGADATLLIAGIAEVAASAVSGVRAVTTRMNVRAQLAGTSPI